MELKITGGTVLIDEVDYPMVCGFTWRTNGKHGYAVTRRPRLGGEGEKIYMHRLIMGAPADLEVDHVNRNTLDNRRENLRLVTHTINCRNSKIHANNTSGYSGIARKRENWRAYITIDGKQQALGVFKNKTDAVGARQCAEVSLGWQP